MCWCNHGFGVGSNVQGGDFLKDFFILDLCCGVRAG